MSCALNRLPTCLRPSSIQGWGKHNSHDSRGGSSTCPRPAECPQFSPMSTKISSLAPVLSVSSTLLMTSVGPVAPPGSLAPPCVGSSGPLVCTPLHAAGLHAAAMQLSQGAAGLAAWPGAVPAQLPPARLRADHTRTRMPQHAASRPRAQPAGRAALAPPTGPASRRRPLTGRRGLTIIGSISTNCLSRSVEEFCGKP